MTKGAVIIDVDGVLNSFSNRKFYAKFILEVGRSLRFLNPNRKNIIESIKAFKKSGANGLFTYLKCMANSDEKYDKICNSIIEKLDFSSLPKNKLAALYLKNISKDKMIIVRTDGLAKVAEKVWQNVVGERFDSNKVIFSGIRDNNFKIKTDEKSWEDFAKKYDINLNQSILIDDSKKNIQTAKKLGLQCCHVNKSQSFASHLVNIAKICIKNRKDKQEDTIIKLTNKMMMQIKMARGRG